MFRFAEENRENKGELCTADFGILSKNRGHKLAYYAVRASIVNVHNNGCEKDDVSTNTRDEKIGFMNALANSGLSFAEAEKSVFFEPNTYAGGSDFANRFVHEGLDFTALYLMSSEQCTGFVAKFQQLGKQIPADLSLLVLNRVPILLGSGISITTLDQPSEEMGMKAVELLLNRSANPKTDHTNVQFSATLKAGSSIKVLADT